MTEPQIDLSSVPIYEEDGLRHVRLEDIPEAVRPAFDKFAFGMTMLVLNDGGTGVYEWDWKAFLRKRT